MALEVPVDVQDSISCISVLQWDLRPHKSTILQGQLLTLFNDSSDDEVNGKSFTVFCKDSDSTDVIYMIYRLYTDVYNIRIFEV